MRRNDLIVACGLLLAVLTPSCRDGRRYATTEDLIFDSVPAKHELVTQTITGFVSCPTCPPDASSMLIEVTGPQLLTLEPLLREPFGRVGAYEVAVKVRPAEPLVVKAIVYTSGGIREVTQEVMAVADAEDGTASMTVNLRVP